MLKQSEIRAKIYKLADAFQDALDRGQEALAYNIYRKASQVAVFVEMDPEDMNRLFGYAETEEEVNPEHGLFDREEVRRIGWKIAIKKDT